MQQNSSCAFFALGILILGLLWLYKKMNERTESYANFNLVSCENYLPNTNAFGNYYRIGSRLSEDLGWKPSDTWDHMRPEYNDNECSGCWV